MITLTAERYCPVGFVDALAGGYTRRLAVSALYRCCGGVGSRGSCVSFTRDWMCPLWLIGCNDRAKACMLQEEGLVTTAASNDIRSCRVQIVADTRHGNSGVTAVACPPVI